MHPQEDRNRLRVEEVALRQGLRWIPPRSLPSKHLATEGANRSGLARGPLSARRVPSPRLEVAAKEAKEATARRTWASHREVRTACRELCRRRVFLADCWAGGKGKKEQIRCRQVARYCHPLGFEKERD